MADVKWIKITTDMFDNRKLKHLRRMPEGNNIVLIWVMLLTMAGRCNAGGMIFLTENIPYTTKMLADELDFEENTVALALNVLTQLNMIVTDNGYFAIAGWDEYQNTDGMEKIREQNRIRQKKWYDKQNKLPNVRSNVSITQPNATEVEGDKEIDKEIDKEEDDEEAIDINDEDNKLKIWQGNVMLTDNQLGDLLERLGLDVFNDYVNRLDEYIDKTGYSIKSHYDTILKWYTEDCAVKV